MIGTEEPPAPQIFKRTSLIIATVLAALIAVLNLALGPLILLLFSLGCEGYDFNYDDCPYWARVGSYEAMFTLAYFPVIVFHALAIFIVIQAWRRFRPLWAVGAIPVVLVAWPILLFLSVPELV